MDVKSTRLRYVSSKELEPITQWIAGQPFKVELKSLVLKGTKFYQTFVIPDNVPDEFPSVDLDEL